MKLIVLSTLLVLSLSVMYSIDSNYKISLQRSPIQLAHSYYVDRARNNGWSQFYVYASSGYDILTQYRAAGYLQGYSTYKEIYSAYNNFYNSILQGSPNVNIKVKDFVDKQLDWIDLMYRQNPRDQYWIQAYALIEQVRYMYKGFIFRVNQQKSSIYNLGFSQFYYLTNVGDLQDIIPAFSNSEEKTPNKGQCNAFIKIIQDKLYVTQSTFNIYSFMLRFHKIYSFPTTRSFQPASEILSFTSRPGDLQSKDDFYLLSSGLSVVQTSLSNFNKSNYELLTPKSVPTWIRHLVANRLAKTPSQWANIFLKFRSYTHNNQWLVIDMGKFNRQNKTQILMVQQGYAQSAVTNFTQRFYEKGFVASYNVPFDHKISKSLEYQKYPYNYQNDPRATQFAHVSEKIHDYDTLKKLLLTNDNQNPCDGIAPRCDITEKNPILFGMIDQKIASSSVLLSNTFEAISGPPTNNGKYPQFNWANWPNTAHLGMPDVFNFTWVNLPFDYQQQAVQLATE